MLSAAEISDLRARNPIETYAAELGVRLRRRAGRLVGACPLCGGGPRSERFEIKRPGSADASFVCAACNEGGDVIKLVQLVHRLDFRAAVERLGGTRAIDPAEAERRQREIEAKRADREAEAERYREKERERCRAIWLRSLPAIGSDAEDYLKARAIFDVAAMRVRFSPQQAYFDGETVDETGRRAPRLIHRGPAMLAPIVDAASRFRGLHITWLDAARPGSKAELFDPETGEALPAKKMRGHKAGGYLDVFPGGDPRLVYLGEGIESVASVREAMTDGAVYRVAGDLGNLAGRAVETVAHPTAKDRGGRPRRVPGPQPDLDSPACPVPDECGELVLLKDGDSDPFLTDLAMERAAARHDRPGRRIAVAEPGEGLDFNDVARAWRAGRSL
jgi:hypothetical protein